MSSEDITWSPGNNSATVKALLLSRLQTGIQPVRNVHPYYQPWSTQLDLPPPLKQDRIKSDAHPAATIPPPACPMHDAGAVESTPSSSAIPSSSTLQKLNPLNMLPTLSQERAANQKEVLSTARTRSTIPRAVDAPAPGASPYDKATPTSGCPVPHDQRASMTGGVSPNDPAAPSEDDSTWEYPSPQQFYNALARKGWETPEEHVEMMVMVHNFLNERAWQEVLDWEKDMGIEPRDVSLARFQGKPGTLSPKARIFTWAAMIAPSRFHSEPPFDRHDWVVRRPSSTSDQKGKDVRYIIDYYSAPDDPETDEPVFHLDVRPALDSPEAAMARLKRSWTEWQTPKES
jgi:cytochrome c heme-lyase